MTTTPDTPIRKKLIEVSIPLEDINAARGSTRTPCER
jgi:putative DNA methylase